ncbi:MAG: hypothetical protein JNM17_11530 [Archangium sp.]|nr:hypothetical protein [Archangium sp.]
MKRSMMTVALLVLAGCSSQLSDESEPIANDSLRIGVPARAQNVGAQFRPNATAKTLDDALVGVSAVAEWSSSDEEVASFVEPGVVRFNHAGTATLTARYGGQTATVEVTASASGALSVVTIGG